MDISALGFHGIQMLGWTEKVYRRKAETLKASLNLHKLKPVALSWSGLSPNPARIDSNTTQFKNYVVFMKHLGEKFSLPMEAIPE